jgi:hypothetical protein
MVPRRQLETWDLGLETIRSAGGVAMRRVVSIAMGMLAVLACVGCSSPGGYLRDRGLDLLLPRIGLSGRSGLGALAGAAACGSTPSSAWRPAWGCARRT